jgi:DNA-binding MltR family transcriptional regulator
VVAAVDQVLAQKPATFVTEVVKSKDKCVHYSATWLLRSLAVLAVVSVRLLPILATIVAVRGEFVHAELWT